MAYGRSSRAAFPGKSPQPVDGAVDHGSPDAEEVGEFGLGVGPWVVQLQQVLGLVWLELRLLAA
jgi:hypothetical protein